MMRSTAAALMLTAMSAVVHAKTAPALPKAQVEAHAMLKALDSRWTARVSRGVGRLFGRKAYPVTEADRADYKVIVDHARAKRPGWASPSEHHAVLDTVGGADLVRMHGVVYDKIGISGSGGVSRLEFEQKPGEPYGSERQIKLQVSDLRGQTPERIRSNLRELAKDIRAGKWTHQTAALKMGL